MAKRVGIVVVTYNRLELLIDVIESIHQQTFTDFDIVVVNNGSTESTTDWLNGQDDIITITQENLGGAGGFNTGMRYVAEHGYVYCWVMDDDVICKPTALAELMKAITSKPDIGFVCSRVLGVSGQPMNTPVPMYKSDIKDAYSDVFEMVNSHAMVRVTNATFVSVLIPTKIIRELGLPYKEFFIWGDDYEYTERISSKYKSYIACRSEVDHLRKEQAPLDFNLEKDKKRICNYYYKFRNESFTQLKSEGCIAFIDIFKKTLFASIHFLIKLDFRRFGIYFRSQWALLFFHPHIEYPNND